MDMCVVDMGSHDKLVLSLRPAHGQFIADLLCQLRGDLSRLKVSSPVIKCKKRPRKKCSFVAEVKGKG